MVFCLLIKCKKKLLRASQKLSRKINCYQRERDLLEVLD